MSRQALLRMMICFGMLANLAPTSAAPGFIAVPSARPQVSAARASQADIAGLRLMVRMP